MPVSKSKLLRLLLEFPDLSSKKEQCGLILKGNQIVECPNVHPQPELGFEIDPESIIRHEEKMVGTWHTHPEGNASLSDEDYTCFLNWPHLEHYIIAKEEVSRYYVKEGIVYNDS